MLSKLFGDLMHRRKPGRLFIVSTPIGNLEDFSLRGAEVLKTVQLVACEDTRRSRVLFERFGVRTPMASLPAFSEGERAKVLIRRLIAGDDLALVTDAGSPGIADPGSALVQEAIAAHIEVVPIPGPAALIAALSASGLPSGRFHFLGFLPRKHADARAMCDEVIGLSATLIFYESPRRLGGRLAFLYKMFGDRQACVARELTKLHEEFDRGTLEGLTVRYRDAQVKGEVVILVAGFDRNSKWKESEVLAALQAGLQHGERLKTLSSDLGQRSGWPSQELYRLGVRLRRSTHTP